MSVWLKGENVLKKLLQRNILCKNQNVSKFPLKVEKNDGNTHFPTVSGVQTNTAYLENLKYK